MTSARGGVGGIGGTGEGVRLGESTASADWLEEPGFMYALYHGIHSVMLPACIVGEHDGH